MQEKIKVLALCCTHGRVKALERSVRCFLDQDYDGPAVMFICNSGLPLSFPDYSKYLKVDNKFIQILNIDKDSYSSVGEKYSIALERAMGQFPDIEVVTSWDDDDIFLPTHLSKGVEGYYDGYTLPSLYGGPKLAYKPELSYYRYRDSNDNMKIIRNENTYEPSIFVNSSWLVEKGYAPVSRKYHKQWLDPLVSEHKIYVNPYGESTLVYNWGDPGIYKMSGSATDNRNNLDAYLRKSLDMGTGILRPAKDNSMYYKEIDWYKSNLKN